MKGQQGPRRMITHGTRNVPQDGSAKRAAAARARWKLRHGIQPNRAERRALKEDA
jgi:hypothetical protein